VHHEPKKDRSVMIGWIVAGAFLVGAAVVVLKVKATKDEEHAAELAHAAEVKGVYDRLMAYDASVPSSAAELVADAAASEASWKRASVSAEISARLAVARNAIESEKQRAELRARMDEVEAGLAEPEMRSSDELTEIRRRIDELEPRTGVVGTEFAARVATAKKSVVRILAEKLLEEAREVGGDIEGKRAALQRYARAEDDLRKFLEASITAEDKEGEAFFKERYQACIIESDELLAQTFTADLINQVQPRDLLDPSTAEQWNASVLEGFRHELAGGTLRVWGAPAGTRSLGLLSIGDREQWRDWVLDIDFTLVQGSAQVYMRLGPRADSTVEFFLLAPEALRDIQYGERISARLSFIGSRWTLAFPEVSDEVLSTDVKWTKLRRGAIGFAIPDETELVVHRMRIRVLR
jgi:hypothetical protein